MIIRGSNCTHKVMILLLIICLLFGCSTPDLDNELPEVASISGDASMQESSTYNIPSEKEESAIVLEPTQNESIYDMLSNNTGNAFQYSDILIAIDEGSNAKIVDSSIFNADNIQNEFLMGCLASSFGRGNLATMNIISKEVYESGLWISNAANLHFFENDVVAVVGNYQIIDAEDYNRYRPLLLDNQCVPLDVQLQFDYGKSKESAYGLEDEFWIIALAYRASDDRYIALFSKNPYFEKIPDDIHTDVTEFDNTICELGIATFNSNGEQLKRYMLNELYHALNIRQQKNAASLPLLYLIDNETAMIIPQSASWSYKTNDLESPEDYSIEPVQVNLADRSYFRWSESDTTSFLKNSEIYKGEIKFGFWNIVKHANLKNIECVYTEEALLVFKDDNDIPLFALPKQYHLKLYHEVDATKYMIFSSK